MRYFSCSYRIVIISFFIFCGFFNVNADITVKDYAGREIKLASSATRIISLAPHITENLFVIGAEKLLVGASAYSDYPLAAKSLPIVSDSNKLYLEEIIKLEPDLVLAWCENNEKYLIELEKLGYPIYRTCPSNLDDIAAEILTYGKMTGNNVKAKAVAERFITDLNAISKRYTRLKMKKNKKTRVFFYLSHKPIFAIGSDTLQNQIIELCGAKNALEELNGYPIINLETIILAKPDIIVSSIEELNAIQWSKLGIDSGKQLKAVEPDVLLRPTTRLVKGVEHFCHVINENG